MNLWKQNIIDTNLSVGEGSQIAESAFVDASSDAITIGKNCSIYPGAMLLPYGGFIIMGDNCTVNPYSVLYGHGGLKIGNNVRIATHTVIIPANHNFNEKDTPIYAQGLSKKGIVIEDDVWIGCNVSILDGVTIGRGSVIGAGSLVNKSVEPYSIMGGNPAQLLKKRG